MTKTEIAEVFIDKDDFLHINLIGKVGMNLELAKELESVIVKECGGRRRPFLFEGKEIGIYAMISAEAREYLAKSEKLRKLRIAEVFLADKLQNRLTANAYIKKNQPGDAAKVFKNSEKKKAINWLKNKKMESI